MGNYHKAQLNSRSSERNPTGWLLIIHSDCISYEPWYHLLFIAFFLSTTLLLLLLPNQTIFPPSWLLNGKKCQVVYGHNWIVCGWIMFVFNNCRHLIYILWQSTFNHHSHISFTHSNHMRMNPSHPIPSEMMMMVMVSMGYWLLCFEFLKILFNFIIFPFILVLLYFLSCTVCQTEFCLCDGDSAEAFFPTQVGTRGATSNRQETYHERREASDRRGYHH